MASAPLMAKRENGFLCATMASSTSSTSTQLQHTKLPKDAFEDLNALERHKRFNQPSRWGFDISEKLGQEKVTKIAEDAAEENKEKFTV